MKFGLGLPAKLLLLTAAFVMLAEVFIFVPSVANYRRNWLMQRVVAAKIASLALEASGGTELPERLRQELLTTAGVHAVSVKRTNFRWLVLGMPDDATIADVYDIRNQGTFALMRDGLSAFMVPSGRLIRVIGSPEMMPFDQIDIVIDETPLRAALWKFAGNIFWVSLAISATSAALVYLALTWLLVRPMVRLTRNMKLYRENPEDPGRIIVPSSRSDEIGVAEKELAALQSQLSGFLREKSHLANIGLAVSKINHDLRNMLASAQIVSDRLATVSDPTVQRFTPRLIRALDRAITLCVDTLKYGRSKEAPPNRTAFLLCPLLTEITESLGTEELNGVRFSFSAPPTLEVFADRDQLFRVLSNLTRNALEAIREAEPPVSDPKIEVVASREGGFTYIRVKNNGPSIPPEVRPHLFKAFQSSSRQEGNGLGLVICAELVRAHGGDISLDETGEGASFVVKLPAAPKENARRSFEQARIEGRLAQRRFNR